MVKIFQHAFFRYDEGHPEEELLRDGEEDALPHRGQEHQARPPHRRVQEGAHENVPHPLRPGMANIFFTLSEFRNDSFLVGIKRL